MDLLVFKILLPIENCSTGYDDVIILDEHFDEDLLTPKGDFSLNLLRGGLQSSLPYVLQCPVSHALRKPSDVAEEIIFLFLISGSVAALFIGLH